MINRLLYTIKNWRSRWRAIVFGAYTPVPNSHIVVHGELSAKVINASQQVQDYGVISRRVVTTTGVNFLRDDFSGGIGGADISMLNYHDSGTGTNPELVADIDLQIPSGPSIRVTGAQSTPASKQYRSTATISYTSTLAITEHGIFNQSTRGAGSVLWDRSVFAPINVTNGDSIQFIYTLTIMDGG